MTKVLTKLLANLPLW